MHKNYKTSNIIIVAYYMLISVTALMLLLFDVNVIYTICLIMWILFVSYAAINYIGNFPLLCFLISFFVFLLGREFAYFFLGVKKYYTYLEKYNNITFTLLAVSLICIFISYFFLSKLKFKNVRFKFEKIGHIKIEDKELFRKVVEVFLILSLIAAMMLAVLQVIYVRKNNYLDFYCDGGVMSNLGVLSYLSSFLNIALSIYLVTNPRKKDAIKYLALYEIYGLLILLTGHRYSFVAISMYVGIYCCIREKIEGNWIKKSYVIAILLLLPFMVVAMTAIDAIRVGHDYKFTSFVSSLVNFLDQQGGSDNIIKRIFYYKKDLEDLHWTSFSNLRTNIIENAIMRKMFNITSYTGNSIAHALKGYSLAHRLSYYEYGNWYLDGHGVGSCYIAELYHDFSWIGVVAGNVLYGLILKGISNIKFDNILKDTILLTFIYGLIFTPRSEFDSPIANVSSLFSIICIILIVVIYKLLRVKYSYQHEKEKVPLA